MSIRTEPCRPDAGNRERFRARESSVAAPSAAVTATSATRIVAGTATIPRRISRTGRPPSTPATIDEVEDDDHREERDDRRQDDASQVHVSPRSECEA